MAYQIRVMSNGRIAARGLSRSGQGVNLQIDSQETIPVSIDWSGFLGSDTISSVTNDASGATISGASNTTTTATFKISGADAGLIQHRITTTNGAIKELPIMLNGTDAFTGGTGCYC